MPGNKFLILAIVLLAFFLRVIGGGYGLPQQFIGDEFLQVAIALKMLDEKSLIPNFPSIFYHQPLSAYISTLGIGGFLAFQLLAGKFEGVEAMRDFYAVHSAELLIVPRFLSAFLGALAVWILYFIGRELFGKRAGILAALLGAVDLLLVFTNHSGRVWGYMTFFIALAFWASVKLFQEDKWKNYLKSAGATLLAAANLLPGIITFVPSLVSRFAWRNKKMWLSLGLLSLGLLVILALSPRGLGAVLLRFDINIPFLSQAVFKAPANPFSHAAEETFLERIFDPFLTIFNYSPVLFILFFAGAIFLRKEDRRKFRFLISFPVAYYIFIGPLFSYGWVARALIPFPIYFAPVAAYAILKIAERFAGHPRRALAFIAAAAILPSIIFSVWFDAKILREDTRTQAISWIYQNLPENSRIITFSHTNEVINQSGEVLELLKKTAPEELNTRQRTLLAADESAYSRPYYFAWDARDIPPAKLPDNFFKNNNFKYYLRTVWGFQPQSYFDEVMENEFSSKKLIIRFSPVGDQFNKNDLLSAHNMIYPVRALVKAETFGPVVEIYEIGFK